MVPYAENIILSKEALDVRSAYWFARGRDWAKGYLEGAREIAEYQGKPHALVLNQCQMVGIASAALLDEPVTAPFQRTELRSAFISGANQYLSLHSTVKPDLLS